MRIAYLAIATVTAIGCGGSSSSTTPPVDDTGPIDSTVLDTSTGDDTGIADDANDTSTTSDSGMPVDSSIADTGGDDGAIDAGDAFDANDAFDSGLPTACLGVDAADESGAEAACGVRVRLMAANLTSGNGQQYEQPAIDIFQGLKPDVVMIQEFNYGAGTLRQLVDTAFGPSFAFYVEPGGSIPNGVISRYPILSSGTWDDPSTTDREDVWAQIDVPGPTDLWVVSMHLLTTSATARDTQARFIVSQVQANFPAGAFVAIAGDTNTAVETEAAIVDFSAITFTGPPYAVDQQGNDKTNGPRSRPHDWVLPSFSLHALEVPVVVGANVFPSGLVFDSRVYTPLSDVPPVVATDSAATNMQHMAVVRDFVLGP